MIITVDIDGVPLCDLGGLGFEVTRITNSRASLKLPDGWQLINQATQLDFIIDDKERKRCKIFYGINLTRIVVLSRYTVEEKWNGDIGDIIVLDMGQKIATIHSETFELYGGDEAGFVRRKEEAIAAYFADKPDWRNPLAYWSDHE